MKEERDEVRQILDIMLDCHHSLLEIEKKEATDDILWHHLRGLMLYTTLAMCEVHRREKEAKKKDV